MMDGAAFGAGYVTASLTADVGMEDDIALVDPMTLIFFYFLFWKATLGWRMTSP